MNDLEPYELTALSYAGQMLGEYLESINQSDIARLTPQQWQTMLEVLAISYTTKRAELQPCPF